MLLGYSEKDSVEAYIQQNKDTIRASNELFYHKIITEEFKDHTQAIMRAGVVNSVKIITKVREFGLLESYQKYQCQIFG